MCIRDRAKICSNVKVTATDISAEAVETAEANAEDLRVKVRFITGDMFEPVKGRKFDMIVSNPPYISCLLYTSRKNVNLKREKDNGIQRVE